MEPYWFPVRIYDANHHPNGEHSDLSERLLATQDRLQLRSFPANARTIADCLQV